MLSIKQNFSVSFAYDVLFTTSVFDSNNPLFANLVRKSSDLPSKKVLFVLDEGLLEHYPGLFQNIQAYANQYKESFRMQPEPVIIPGGEAAKNSPEYVERILEAINKCGIDRHSFVAAVGGGSVIDAAGYAAGIAHRGIRLIRIPTTVLAQNDAAVGVKNGVNAYGKKNFLGTFVPPFAVINDSEFLHTLDHRDWRSGISEAVKVALLKDVSFFEFIEQSARPLANRDMATMQKLIHRCAELHLEHISTSGDPFEMGSSRPLDFGHWAAHKLEQLTNYKLRHGEAVAIGLALDVTYSFLKGDITQIEWERITAVLQNVGFSLYAPELKSNLENPADENSLLHGLEEFREHLGGRLTIMLLEGIGKGVEVHSVDTALYAKAIEHLEKFEKTLV